LAPEGLSTQQNPQAGRAEMEMFNVMTRLAFGATLIFAGITLLCEQLLYYFS
jgi:hypothetical protein